MMVFSCRIAPMFMLRWPIYFKSTTLKITYCCNSSSSWFFLSSSVASWLLTRSLNSSSAFRSAILPFSRSSCCRAKSKILWFSRSIASCSSIFHCSRASTNSSIYCLVCNCLPFSCID